MTAPASPGASPGIDRLVPFAHVADLPRSMAFYALLGFEASNTVEHEGRLTWAWLCSREANLMIAQADPPVDPAQQAVLFYLYTADVAALQADLRAKGVEVGEITRPFYMPQGEVRVTDPDGYVLLIGQPR